MDQTHFYSISIWLHDHHDTDADDDDHERTRHNGGGDDDEAGQRRLDDRAVRERRPCVAVALVSWKWQK